MFGLLKNKRLEFFEQKRSFERAADVRDSEIARQIETSRQNPEYLRRLGAAGR